MDEWPTPTYLRNHEAVLAVFGCWPSFHDAPLLSLEHVPTAGSVDLLIHAFEMMRETDERGYFLTTKHHLIRFKFLGASEPDFSQFDVPNTLFDFVFSPPSDFDATGRFHVQLNSVTGGDCFARFAAESGEVASIKACDKQGNPT